jgi:hypothetical protein
MALWGSIAADVALEIASTTTQSRPASAHAPQSAQADFVSLLLRLPVAGE